MMLGYDIQKGENLALTKISWAFTLKIAYCTALEVSEPN